MLCCSFRFGKSLRRDMLCCHHCARTQAAAAAPKVKTLGATDLLGIVSKRLKAAPKMAIREAPQVLSLVVSHWNRLQ